MHSARRSRARISRGFQVYGKAHKGVCTGSVTGLALDSNRQL
jgi:hypothetical protein